MTHNIAIFGATSAIAEHTARLYASQGSVIHLIARNEDSLNHMTQDLIVRGATAIHTYVMDMNDTHMFTDVLSEITTDTALDVAYIAYGTLPDQDACTHTQSATLDALTINGISPVMLMNALPRHMAPHGTIAVISSVAGDRGKASNYTYGSAKSMVSTFASGLRQKLYSHHIHVLDIRPGLVDTPMTADFDKGPLWAKPETVAKQIVHAIQKRKDVLYAPSFWWGIMTLFRMVPECIFKRKEM